jgi:hypothetical protein
MSKVLIEQEQRTKKEDGTEETISRRSIVKQDPEDEYYKVYIKMVCVLNQIGGPAASPIMNELLKRCSYASRGQRVVLNADEVEIICSDLKISRQTYYNQMEKLTKAGLIQPLHPDRKRNRWAGTFFVNPYVWGRGSWTDIKEIRSHIVLNEHGGEIHSETSTETSMPAVDSGQTFLFKWQDMEALNKTNKQIKPLAEESESTAGAPVNTSSVPVPSISDTVDATLAEIGKQNKNQNPKP